MMDHKRRWNRVVKHFGEVHDKQVIYYTFVHLAGEEGVPSITPSCGCITTKWNDGKIHMSFKVGPFNINPDGLLPHRETTKSITVKWKSGKTDVLYIKAIVYNENEKL